MLRQPSRSREGKTDANPLRQHRTSIRHHLQPARHTDAARFAVAVGVFTGILIRVCMIFFLYIFVLFRMRFAIAQTFDILSYSGWLGLRLQARPEWAGGDMLLWGGCSQRGRRSCSIQLRRHTRVSYHLFLVSGLGMALGWLPYNTRPPHLGSCGPSKLKCTLKVYPKSVPYKCTLKV